MPTASAIKHYTEACDKPMGLVPGTQARVFLKGGVQTTDFRPLIDGTITAMNQRSDGGYDVTFTYDLATIPVDFLMVFSTLANDGNVADPDPFEEGDWAWKVNQLGNANLTPALTGDVSSTAGQTAVTLNAVNGTPGQFGGTAAIPVVTVNGKGLVTAMETTPVVIGSITDLGVGVGDSLALDVGTAGAPVLFNGAGGTPASLSLGAATGLPVATGIAGLGATVAATLAIPIGDNAGILTKNAALGTPTSGTLTNCAGLTAAGVVGVAATLAETGLQTFAGPVGIVGAFAVGGNFTVATTGAVVTPSSIKSNSPSAGIGYATGAGGTFTQATSKSTTVTVSGAGKLAGTLTTHAAALAAAASVTFQFTNAAIEASDFVLMQIVTGPATVGSYAFRVVSGAGQADITIRNTTAGSLSEAIVFKFIVFKSVTA